MVRYTGKPAHYTSQPATGILLANTGSPAAPTPSAVRRYLRQFLSDPRVIEAPRALWWPILHGIILNTRPKRIARAYAAIWNESGSPLITISEQQRDALQAALAPQFAHPLKVVLGMTYGEPSLAAALDELRRADVRRLLVLPLYPQYSASTVGAVFDGVTALLQRWRSLPDLRLITNYYREPGYIHAVANRVREYWTAHGQPEKLIISYHSLPERYFKAGDPYYHHCRITTDLLVQDLGLSREQWMLTFQSPFGPIKWIDPFLDETLAALPQQGIRHVQVVCPSFAADCLETLEEVAIDGREIFLHAGGEQFGYIPAPNAQPDHCAALAEIVLHQTADWQTITHDDEYSWQIDHSRP